MGIVRNAEPTTEYEKETHKWDTPKRLGGMGPDGYEAFPKMVYKAHRRENGKVMCLDMDTLYAGDMNVVAKAEAFNRTCQLIVQSEGELDRARNTGWCDSPASAVADIEKHAQAIAQAAAEAAYSVQRMSDLAQREHAAADADTDAPITDVIPAPRKRGRPAKRHEAV